MVNWQSLFKWSTKDQYEPPLGFKETSTEDKLWLEQALKKYKFNEEDQMQEICKLLPDTKREDNELF